MIRIAISPRHSTQSLRRWYSALFGFENAVNERGERLIWLAPNVVNRLKAMRGPGESYSDVILRLAKGRPDRVLDRIHANHGSRKIHPRHVNPTVERV